MDVYLITCWRCFIHSIQGSSPLKKKNIPTKKKTWLQKRLGYGVYFQISIRDIYVIRFLICSSFCWKFTFDQKKTKKKHTNTPKMTSENFSTWCLLSCTSLNQIPIQKVLSPQNQARPAWLSWRPTSEVTSAVNLTKSAPHQTFLEGAIQNCVGDLHLKHSFGWQHSPPFFDWGVFHITFLWVGLTQSTAFSNLTARPSERSNLSFYWFRTWSRFNLTTLDEISKICVLILEKGGLQ